MKAKEAQEKRYPHLGCESKKDSRRPSKRIERTSFFQALFLGLGEGGKPSIWLGGTLSGPWGSSGVVYECQRGQGGQGRPRKTKEAHEGQGGTGEKIPSFRLLV